MDIYLDDTAEEYSTYSVTIAYTDEDGNSITPSAVTWTLKDANSNTINSRSDVNISVPGTSNDIILSGADLTISGNDNKRILIVDITYSSDYGAGLKKQMRYHFFITRGTA